MLINQNTSPEAKFWSIESHLTRRFLGEGVSPRRKALSPPQEGRCEMTSCDTRVCAFG